ncbi:uncharacterized protein LOC135126453 [Zophobas morio]|uniref:uncharacterized protein LOC135126453 n=1 Tax=Zophobas morio TaxID=2755281 RepID=UPI0030832538
MTTKNIKGQWYNKRIVRTRSASRMVKIEVVVLLLVESVNCAFFDLTDVDDPLSLLWHHPKNVSGKQANIPCRVPVSPHSGSVILGQCRYKTLCLLSGGEAHSNDACGSFLTCCTQPSVCSKRTKSKVSYFTKDQSAAASYCEHVVEIQSKVCQIRLDFEQFRLAPSTNVKVDANLFHTVCDTDNMTVNPEVQRVPYFCGNNDGQHAYVHLDSQTELRLQVQLGAQGNLNRYWRIKVTQIECPLFWRFLGNSYKSLSYGFNSGENFPLLAPPGAAQYFTEPVGTIRSFGYKDSESEYISGLYYAIAFKKTPRVNCIK